MIEPTVAMSRTRRTGVPVEAQFEEPPDASRSSEGAAARLDQARDLCAAAGLRRITFRGDTDFSQTEHVDRWDADDIRFILG